MLSDRSEYLERVASLQIQGRKPGRGRLINPLSQELILEDACSFPGLGAKPEDLAAEPKEEGGKKRDDEPKHFGKITLL